MKSGHLALTVIIAITFVAGRWVFAQVEGADMYAWGYLIGMCALALGLYGRGRKWWD